VDEAKKKKRAYIALVVGIVMTIGQTGVLLEGTGTGFYGTVMVYLLFGILPIYYGWSTLKNMKRDKEEQQFRYLEKLILQLAVEHRGLLTAMDVTTNSELSLEEAKGVLDMFERKEYARLKIADGGTYVYEFYDIITNKEEEEAEAI